MAAKYLEEFGPFDVYGHSVTARVGHISPSASGPQRLVPLYWTLTIDNDVTMLAGRNFAFSDTESELLPHFTAVVQEFLTTGKTPPPPLEIKE